MSNEIPPEREYVSPAEASKIFGLSTQTLERFRRTGEGPAFVKVGGHTIRYHIPTFRAWMEARTVNNTAEAYYIARGEFDVVKKARGGKR